MTNAPIVINRFLSINISNSNKVNQFWVGSSHARVPSMKSPKQQLVSESISYWQGLPMTNEKVLKSDCSSRNILRPRFIVCIFPFFSLSIHPSASIYKILLQNWPCWITKYLSQTHPHQKPSTMSPRLPPPPSLLLLLWNSPGTGEVLSKQQGDRVTLDILIRRIGFTLRSPSTLDYRADRKWRHLENWRYILREAIKKLVFFRN